MIQGASPLYANFVPPTQVGGYAGTNQGYCGNTYLPDQQAPINSSSGNSGYVQSTMYDGSVDPLGGSMSMVGIVLNDICELTCLSSQLYGKPPKETCATAANANEKTITENTLFIII